MQVNQETLAALYKGYRTTYMEAYQAASPQFTKYTMRTSSNKASEIYHWLGSLPGMKELVGEVTDENIAAHNYTIENKEWFDIVSVKQADIERDSLGIYEPRFRALGRVAAQHPDELCANLLLNGFTSTCYTGSAFFATNHKPQAKGVGFSNKGTDKLTVSSYEAARADIRSRRNAAGRPMRLGDKLLLVVSPAKLALAKRIVEADFVTGLSGNGSETNINAGTATALDLPELVANPEYWFLLDIGQEVKPLIYQEEQTPLLSALDKLDSDLVFHKHVFKYQAYGRYGVGYGLPELAFGSIGTTTPA